MISEPDFDENRKSFYNPGMRIDKKVNERPKQDVGFVCKLRSTCHGVFVVRRKQALL